MGMRSFVSSAVIVLLSSGCADDEFQPAPHAQLVDDLRDGRVERLDVCPEGGMSIYRYLRPGRGAEPERLQVVSVAGGGGVVSLAEAEGVPVYEGGELCD